MDEIKNLVPEQFHASPNLMAFLKAFVEQYTELKQAIEDSDTKTQLATATGKNLDYVGDILGLTRIEAYNLIGGGEEVTDTVYRRALQFKILSNNCSATYEAVRKGLNLLWNGVHTTYTETPSDPATFTVTLDDVPLDDIDPAKTSPLIISASGVQAILDNTFTDDWDFVDEEKFCRETIAYDAYTRYNGRYTYNGTRQYKPMLAEEEL